MKAAIAIIVIVLIGLAGFMFLAPDMSTETETEEKVEVVEEVLEFQLQDGEYAVIPDLSKVNWSGKKPLIDGYINSGSFEITEGNINFDGASSTGGFEIDISTLTVSETKAKPGQETALEGHLKGERWFNVEEYPTASFEITSIESANSENDPFLFNVVGDLTMKGEVGEVSFPARIYADEEGAAHAKASFEIDRTLWGITSGSGSFFDDLADNVIDDMVAMSFELLAVPNGEKAMEEGASMEVPSLGGDNVDEMIVEEVEDVEAVEE